MLLQFPFRRTLACGFSTPLPFPFFPRSPFLTDMFTHNRPITHPTLSFVCTGAALIRLLVLAFLYADTLAGFCELRTLRLRVFAPSFTIRDEYAICLCLLYVLK